MATRSITSFITRKLELLATFKNWDYSLFEDDPPLDEMLKMLTKGLRKNKVRILNTFAGCKIKKKV